MVIPLRKGWSKKKVKVSRLLLPKQTGSGKSLVSERYERSDLASYWKGITSLI